MKTRSGAAMEKFLSGYNCAQSVLWSFSDKLGLEPEAALKVACGFWAGIARRQEVCGAVTGGIMALGLRHGRGEHQERTAIEEAGFREVVVEGEATFPMAEDDERLRGRIIRIGITARK